MKTLKNNNKASKKFAPFFTIKRAKPLWINHSSKSIEKQKKVTKITSMKNKPSLIRMGLKNCHENIMPTSNPTSSASYKATWTLMEST